MIKLKLPDGSERDGGRRSTGKELLAGLEPALKKEVICLKVDGELKDLGAPLPAGTTVSLVRRTDPAALEVLRHSTAHIMAQAVKRLFPEAKLAIGPAIENGFYYDFDLPRPLTPEDLTAIEAEMKKIVKEDYPFTREVVAKEEALARLKAEGEIYKVELVEELEDGAISFYQQGEFTDLCRGPICRLPATPKPIN